MADDPFQILGVPRTVTRTELKAAFRRIARETHPDTSGTAGHSRFVAARRAYEQVLDQLDGKAPPPAPSLPPAHSSPVSRRPRAEPVRAVEPAWVAKARERAYWTAQNNLENAYGDLGWWTRDGLPRWRKP